MILICLPAIRLCVSRVNSVSADEYRKWDCSITFQPVHLYSYAQSAFSFTCFNASAQLLKSWRDWKCNSACRLALNGTQSESLQNERLQREREREIEREREREAGSEVGNVVQINTVSCLLSVLGQWGISFCDLRLVLFLFSNDRTVIDFYILRPRPHYASGIWKRRFHSENASKVFRPHYAGGI